MLSTLRATGLGHRNLAFSHTAMHLHAMIVSCGHSREETPEYDWDGLKRGKSSFVLFQYTIQGRGMLRYGEDLHEVCPGQAMLLHFPYNNRYWLPPDWEPWEFVWIVMSGMELLRIWTRLESENGPLIWPEKDSRAVKKFITIYSEACAGRIVSPFIASEHAYSFAMALSDELSLRKTSGLRPPKIQSVIDFSEESFSRRIGIDDLAHVSGFSRYHFCRLFHKSEGVTPMDYLTGLRIREARRLLTDRSIPVKLVAYRCGFADPNYFCKVFRRAVGVSPGEFRDSGIYM